MFKKVRSAFRNHPAAAERFFSYAQILLGALIAGAAYPLFMTPNRIAPGGITGIATILNHLLQWPVGTVSLILNLPLFLIGYKTMGRIFAFRSLLATVFFTGFIDILPLKPMTDDPLLGALYGGVMLGAGLGLIMRGGATTGGSDMVARMVHKRFQFISTGSFLFAIDFAVVVSAGFLIGTTEAIMKDMDRGVTQLTARGAYTGAERPTLLCVISRSEITAFKRILREEDENAFVIIVEAHEAIGDGFSVMDKS